VEALNHLDKYLEEFTPKLEARGTKSSWASNSEAGQGNHHRHNPRKKARSINQSKAMTSEEIHLNDALEKEGLTVVESDLGEFIMQL